MELWQRIGTYAAGLAVDSAGVKGDPERLARMDLIVAAGGGERDHAVDGAILTGFSMGAYAAYQIARAHPGRWPYLILNEANVPLDRDALRAARVRAVALIAGELGSQIGGERKTADRLRAQGFPARLWVMKKAGHHYSADIETIMAEAIAFVLTEGLEDASAREVER